MKTSLAVAGSDSSGGAGIQADIKTMTMNGVYAMSVITAVTAQNTCGVAAISELSPDFLRQQLDCVFEDIYPDSVKIGMVSSADLIGIIADMLEKYSAKNIVADPVMISTSGCRLIKSEAIEVLKRELLPKADIITPNIPEAEVLSGTSIKTEADMQSAAEAIGAAYKCSVLIKGGHNEYSADDLLYIDGTLKWFRGRRIENPNTHGTGCTLSSAIAANLAKGYSTEDSVARAKRYVSEALESMLDLGKGRGPINHFFNLSGEFSEQD